MSTVKEIIFKHGKNRAGYKSRITVAINELPQKIDRKEVTKELFERRQSTIQNWLNKIDAVNAEMILSL